MQYPPGQYVQHPPGQFGQYPGYPPGQSPRFKISVPHLYPKLPRGPRSSQFGGSGQHGHRNAFAEFKTEGLKKRVRFESEDEDGEEGSGDEYSERRAKAVKVS